MHLANSTRACCTLDTPCSHHSSNIALRFPPPKKGCDPTRIYCGKIAGIEMYTHTSTFAFLLAFIIIECLLAKEKGLMAMYCIFYSIVLWVSVLLHDLCVAFTARR
jgi:hypothetical protein